MLPREAAKDDDSRVDQVGHRILRGWQSADPGTEDLERAVAKRDDQRLL